MGCEVPHRPRTRLADGARLAAREVIQEAPNPIDVAALGAIGVVARPKPVPHLVEGDQRTRVSPLVDDGARWLRLPVGPLEEVDEVDPQGVFGLTNLPVRPSTFALEGLAKCAYLVGQWLVRSGTCQETADPANAVGCSVLLDEPSRQNELAKLLERSLELTHRPIAREATAMPLGRRMLANRVAHRRLAKTHRLGGSPRSNFCPRGMSPGPTNWRSPSNQDWAGLCRRNQSMGGAAWSARKRTQEGVDRRKATQDNCASQVWWVARRS